jgi:hypothetical protein
MFHLLMNVVRVHETLPYYSLFYHELFCFVSARCWSSLCRALETNGETSLMQKLSIVFPMMFRTFPTNTMIKNGMNFPQYRT